MIKIIQFINKDKLLNFSLFLVLIQILLAVFAPLLSFKDPYEIVVLDRLKSPNYMNLLGTDHLGRDVLARVVYG
jgi:peptide/nickel transport system permease protein